MSAGTERAKKYPIIVVPKPACPHCASKRLRSTKTERHAAISVRYMLCRDCGGRVKVISE